MDFEAVRSGNLESLKSIVTRANVNSVDKRGCTALILTCRRSMQLQEQNGGKSSEDLVSFLLEQGADTAAQDKNGKTALMHACDCGSTDIVHLLLRSSKNDKTTILRQQDSSGETALHRACAQGHTRTVASLLEILVANDMFDVVNHRCQRQGWTPLHVSCHHGHLYVTEVLFRMAGTKLDIHLQDNNGLLPLELSCKHTTNTADFIELFRSFSKRKFEDDNPDALESCIERGEKRRKMDHAPVDLSACDFDSPDLIARQKGGQADSAEEGKKPLVRFSRFSTSIKKQERKVAATASPTRSSQLATEETAKDVHPVPVPVPVKNKLALSDDLTKKNDETINFSVVQEGRIFPAQENEALHKISAQLESSLTRQIELQEQCQSSIAAHQDEMKDMCREWHEDSAKQHSRLRCLVYFSIVVAMATVGTLLLYVLGLVTIDEGARMEAWRVFKFDSSGATSVPYENGTVAVLQIDGIPLTASELAFMTETDSLFQELILSSQDLRECPVHAAVQFGYQDDIDVSVEEHAGELNVLDSKGRTALDLAALTGQLDVVYFLLCKGAIFAYQDKAVMMAFARNRAPFADHYLQYVRSKLEFNAH